MLEQVAKHHKEWLRIVKQLGGDDYSEDIVQEMYIKLHKYSSPEKCINNGKVNKYYVFLTLKSILYSYFNERKRIRKESIDNFYDITEPETDEDLEAFNKLSEMITEESEKWHWYDQQIFNYYRDHKTSFRKMSEHTKISWVSLFHTIKKCKRKIKENLKEDIEDYKNKDYDKISNGD